MARQTSLPDEWHRQADVVVVGYGAAGTATAITAHDAGATVLMLEKAPRGQEGGNSRVAGQGYFAPSSVDKTITYLTALCGPYPVPEDVIQVCAEEMCTNNDWVKSIAREDKGVRSVDPAAHAMPHVHDRRSRPVFRRSAL